jgi:hypothetical protein
MTQLTLSIAPTTATQRERNAECDLSALCFKVPRRFRQWLKAQAAIRGVTMTELLIAALESYVRSNPPSGSDGSV